MQRMSLVGVAGVCLMPILGQMPGLKPEEKKLVQSIESRLPEELAALEKAVNIDSGTFNTAGVREAGRYFHEQHHAIRLHTPWARLPESAKRPRHPVPERISLHRTRHREPLHLHQPTILVAHTPRC